MSEMLPSGKPRITREQALLVLKAKGIALASVGVAVIGIRGYYLNSMGVPGRNDRGVYDDAAVVISANAFATFNFNTDPSIYRAGIATLKPGVILYKKGLHGISKPGGGYPAFRPATPDEAVPVTRDENSGQNLFGDALNIHHGYNTTTGSEGCQTVPPEQWDGFRHLVYLEMDRAGVAKFPYILVTEAEWEVDIAGAGGTPS